VTHSVLFNARILIVEDNATNQFFAQCTLKEFEIHADVTQWRGSH
jgi:hypothetical protein